MIKLSNNDFIIHGACRAVYNHPTDFSKIIKINLDNKVDAKYGNEREIESLKAFNKINNNINNIFNFIPKFYGYIDTNIGKGLCFEKIFDYDTNKTSDKILDYINKNSNDAIRFKDIILKQVKNMFDVFAENLIFTTSFGLENIVIQKLSKNNIRVLTIDFKIQKHKELIPITKIPFFMKLKIKRRGKRLLKQLQYYFNGINNK